ncbi:MAG: efflux RND transporter periplasmic adaptor subunit, partial [Acidobacteriota bacterium]
LLEVEVDVLSADAVRIEPGMAVRLERWGGAADLEAVVRTVEPVGFTKVSALGVEEQRVWVIADLVDPPERRARLGDGYRVEAAFLIWSGDDVLQIPSSALFRHRDGWAVFLVQDEVARVRPVEIGHQAGLRTEVLEGLSEGDRVVVHPPDDLTDGAHVRLASGDP